MNKHHAIPTDPKIYAQAIEVVKARVKRWPSAYASGQVVILYKKLMSDAHKQPYKNYVNKHATALARWYKEDWIDIRTGQKCGDIADSAKNKNINYYPTCRPNKRVNKSTPVTVKELTPVQKAHMIKEKQKAKANTVHYIETLRAKH
jgi:hypothetical protein